VLTESARPPGRSRSGLTADRTEIDADGEDVADAEVEVLDKEGRAVPTAGN
jgi:beta-galactosidase